MTREEAARRNTMQNELKPCPFCGGKAKFRCQSYDKSGKECGWSFDVRCGACGVESPKYYRVDVIFNDDGEIKVVADGRAQAIKDWNRRWNDDRA